MERLRTKNSEALIAPLLVQVAELTLLLDANGISSPRDDPKQAKESLLILTAEIEKFKSLQNGNCIPELSESWQEALRISGDSLILAAGKIAALVDSISDDQPLSAQVKKRLGKYTLLVAEAAAKILMIKEQVRCHEVVEGLQLLNSRLKDALTVHDIDDLVKAFKCYSAVLVDALTRASRWQRDLSDNNMAATAALGTLIADMRRSSGSLSSVLQTRIACSGSEASMEMQSSMASDLIITAENMASIVLGELSEEALGGSWTGPGYFVRQMDEILEYLNSADSAACTTPTDRRPYDVLLESIVRHSTGVASAFKEWTNAMHGDRILRSCASIFRISRTMKKREKLVATAPNYHELRSELDNDRCALIGELHDLERYVNTALLEGIVSVFKETVEPLDRLVHAALAHRTSGEKEIESSHMLKRCIQEFLDHANCVYLLAGFVADSSTEEERVRALKCSVANLKKIDPGILPAIVGCCQEESASVAGKKLQCLYRHWNRELQCLITMIDEVTDPIMFVDISASQLARYVQELTAWQAWRAAASGHSYRRFITTSRAVIGHSKRAAAAVKQAISCNKEPLLRRIMHAELSELKQAIARACRTCHVLSSENLWPSLAQAAEWSVEFATVMEELLAFGRVILDHLRMLSSCLSSGDPAELLHAAIVRRARTPETDDNVLQPRTVDQATHDDALLSLHQVPPTELPYVIDRQQQSSSLGSGDGNRRENSRHAVSNGGHRRIASATEQQVAATVRAAMACDWAGTDQLLKFALLPWSRYVIDVAESLKSACIIPSATRSTLATGCNLLQELTPELLALSERIALLRSNDVSAFQELSHRWHATGAELEKTCTFLVESYDATCCDLVDSAERKEAQQFWGASQAFLQCNETFTSLLDAADAALREAALLHCLSSDKPASAISASSAFSAALDSEKVRDLGRLREQVLQTGQRILAIPAGVDENEGETTDDERRVARSVAVRWAACAVCIESEAKRHCDEACPYAFGGLDWRADGSLTDSARYWMAQRDLAHMVHVVCTRGGSIRGIPDSARHMLAETEAILQCLAGAIDENGCCTTAAAPTATATAKSQQSVTCIGRELRAALLRLRWRVKATSLLNTLVDPVVTKLCHPLYTLAMAAAANGRQEPTRVGATAVFPTDIGNASFESSLRSLASGLTAVRSSIASAEAAVVTCSGNASDIGSSPASNPSTAQMSGARETARQCVDSLLAIVTSHLPPLLQSLAGYDATAAVVNFKHIQRHWSCHVLRLTCVLRDGSDQHTRDARQHVSRWLRDLGIDPNAVHNSNSMASGVPVPYGANEGRAVSPASRASQPRQRSNVRPMADDGIHSPTSIDSSIRQTARATSSSNTASPAAATGLLDIEDNSWASERNPTVRGVKEVAELLHTITAFGYDKGQLKGTRQLCRIARSAAEKCSVISEFAREVGLRTRHERAAERLNKSAEKIQTLAAQMRVLSIAGQDTSDDVMTRKMLVQNASNLRQAVATTMLDIEATSIEGLDLLDDTRNSSPIFDIISGWKRHLKNSRRINFNTCSLNDLGLRVQERSHEGPKLADLILSAKT